MKTLRRPSTSIFFMVICILLAHVPTESKYHDVCIQEAEAVNLRCGPGQIIQVNSAKYGRMRTGRCIQRDIDIGCDTDILFLLDRWCSGKKDCHVVVPNKELVDANQCPNDMLMYLEYDADCVTVAEADGNKCRRERKYRASTNEGTLASLTVDQTGCGSNSSPWTIEGAPGQRVNISMLDFAYTPTSSGAKASTMTCEPYGYIVERKLGINRTVCGGVARRSHVYMSASSAVEIYINVAGMRTASSSFILNYAVIGCPDARPPDHAWYKRTADTAEMGCEWSDLSWKMTCSGNRWIGSMGNCSVARSAEVAAKKEDFKIHPVLSMGLIIGLAALILILVCVIGFGFYCMKNMFQGRQMAPQATTCCMGGTRKLRTGGSTATKKVNTWRHVSPGVTWLRNTAPRSMTRWEPGMARERGTARLATATGSRRPTSNSLRLMFNS
nr:Gal-binding and CUB domains containing receptor 12 [Arenicola marina]